MPERKGLPGMKLVFDTNVILDVLAKREPFFGDSLKALDFIARKDVSGAITANIVTDVFFLYQILGPR